MRPPTANAISQTQHGLYKAVDYHSSPDPYIYAPEDGIVFARLLNAGDAGNELQVIGAHGRHGFCHCEEFYVQPGEQVTKGQKLAKMGYTGLVEPAGPAGRHVHHVLLRPDGTYVYPPSLITEPFVGSEENVMDEQARSYIAGLTKTVEQLSADSKAQAKEIERLTKENKDQAAYIGGITSTVQAVAKDVQTKSGNAIDVSKLKIVEVQ